MKHVFTAALITAAFALPVAGVAQERYPELRPDQQTPQQKAYLENLQKPPRNNTTGAKNPPFKVYMRDPELGGKLEAVSDYVRWGTGLEPRLTELAIMLTARNWSKSVDLARPLSRRRARRARPERGRRHRRRQAAGKTEARRGNSL